MSKVSDYASATPDANTRLLGHDGSNVVKKFNPSDSALALLIIPDVVNIRVAANLFLHSEMGGL